MSSSCSLSGTGCYHPAGSFAYFQAPLYSRDSRFLAGDDDGWSLMISTWG